MLDAGLVWRRLVAVIAAAAAPRMLVLLAAGVILGPSVTDAIDVPLDSPGAELLLTLGVRSSSSTEGCSFRRASSAGWPSASAARGSGRRITALVAGSVAAVAFDVPWRPSGAHRRRRACRADRPGDPDPALRPHRHPAEDRADGDRGVGAQRCHRSGARTRSRRRGPHRRRIGRRSGARLRRGARHLDCARDRLRDPPVAASSPTAGRASGRSPPPSRSSPSSRSATSRSTRQAEAATSARSSPG